MYKTKNTGFELDQAFCLAKFVGMPWRKARPDEYMLPDKDSLNSSIQLPHSWNGKELVVSDRRDGEELLHEICHWIVAPKPFRKLPEFGLGTAPYSDIRSTPVEELHRPYDDYEILACLLEIYTFNILKLDWADLAWNLNFLNAKCASFPGFVSSSDNRRYWLELRRRRLDKLIDKWTQGDSNPSPLQCH